MSAMGSTLTNLTCAQNYALCQERTKCDAAKRGLFDHLVGSGGQIFGSRALSQRWGICLRHAMLDIQTLRSKLSK